MYISELTKMFPSQDACIKHLERSRWPSGPVCPYCFESKRIVKMKGTNRYHCNACRVSLSVTVNTIFHDTKLPLQKWFLAIALITQSKNGVTVKQLQRDLQTTYKTAWFMAMRIRRAVVDHGELLKGIME